MKPVQQAVSLGDYGVDVEAALGRLEQKDANRRIWQNDHTLWAPDPKEIADRLGWLTVTDQMREQAPGLEAFAQEVKRDGFRDVVLLGMGGSSLGPEVLRQVFGSRDGYPRLTVLDSTVPEWIRAVTAAIDPAHTLFLVSSKSGTTVEPLSFYKHFRRLVDGTVGADRAGGHFVAITDPGTPLEGMAHEHGFRKAFLNPPPIGGRYSVLSYFGLVPAALIGVDLVKLLDRADRMRADCAPSVALSDNLGCWLGAVTGGLARRGRDKLTLIASPGIGSFGLWAEQLLAESTGKEGKGIVPVAGEPLAPPSCYGRDRLFVYLRLEDVDGGQPPPAVRPAPAQVGAPVPHSENAALDAAVEQLKAAGQPVIRFDLRDPYDVGSEFFRWEYATAVAGVLLEINPFDQPDVQVAKDQTDRLLRAYLETGRLPSFEGGTLAEASEDGGAIISPPAGDPAGLHALLAQAQQGDYLSVMAYLPQGPEVDDAIAQLRRTVVEGHHIATTAGYGPRFLHSTGQLYKGGPASGLFVQLVAQHSVDVEIPGEPYTFGVLSQAQALGDLQALHQRGRRAVRISLGVDYKSGLRRLIDSLA